MPKEINLRSYVRDLLKPGFVQQVENSVGPGTADTYFALGRCSGWIELKVAREFPKRENTPVFKSLNRGLELEQEAWLYQCARNGGNSWIFAKIVTWYVLVPGYYSHFFNSMTLEEFRRYEILPGDLRGVIVSYAVGEIDDTRTSCTGRSPPPCSVWYEEGLYDFRLMAEERHLIEGN